MSNPNPATSDALHSDDDSDLLFVEQIAAGLARRLPSHIERGDLIAQGNLGLMEARRRFDASRGVPFRCFAAQRIRGAMLDSLRQSDPLTRDERERCKRDLDAAPPVIIVELDSVPETVETRPAVDAVIEQRQLVTALRHAIADLSERERTTIDRYFFRGEPLREIGLSLGVTESRTCQIVSGALKKLRVAIAA